MSYLLKTVVRVGVVGLLAALFSAGCGADLCPVGWVKNATGDCVDPASLNPADGDGPGVINPCPPGWALNANGFCAPIDGADVDPSPDGDGPTTDGDLPTDGDGDSDPPIDGDDTPAQPCASDANCEVGLVCHLAVDGGSCLSACTSAAQCLLWLDGSYCNTAQRCVPGSVPSVCAEDVVCAYGQVCHTQVNDGICYPLCTTEGQCDQFGIQYICNAQNRCVPDPGTGDACDEDADCKVDQVCHLAVDGGACLAPCVTPFECQNYGEDFFCNAEQRCVPPRTGDDCDTNADCAYGDVCHPAMYDDEGRCLPLCTANEECSVYDSRLWCNSAGLCDERPSQPGCEQDTDCSYGNVCHDQASPEGICATPCDQTSDCLLIDPSLSCNALFRCVPGIIPDGDIDEEPPPDGDDDIDEAVDIEPEVDEGPNPCAQISYGGVYLVNLETANVTFVAKRGSSVYQDPTGQSGIYVRDNESGSQFLTHDRFTDGGSLAPAELITGNYSLIAKNRLGQRQTVADNVSIFSDQTIDVQFPFYTVTVHLNKNGQAFPSLPAEYQGELRLYDRTGRRTHVIGKTGTGVNAYNIDVFTSNYDVIFAGYLSSDPDSYQIETLIANDRISANKDYTFDLQTVAVAGEILINGATPADTSSDQGRGEVWLINAIKGDRFRFWQLGKTGAVNFSRELAKGSYTVAFVPPGMDGNLYAWRAPGVRDWLENQSNVEIDIPRLRYKGNVRVKGGSLYENEHLNRGFIYLIDEATQERFPLADLGREGQISFDVLVGPAAYSYRFEGPLIDDAWFIDRSYPSSTHKITWQTGVSLQSDTTQNVDLPIEAISGKVTKNGQNVTVNLNGEYITVRRASASEDIPMVHFGSWTPPNYAARLFPAIYEVRYSGSTLLDRFQNFLVAPEMNVTPSNLTFNFNVQSKILGVTITTDGLSKTLSDLIADGAFDSAEIHVVDETLRNRTTGATEIVNGRFQLERPVGPYTLILRLVKGDTYQEHPIVKEYQLNDNAELQYNVEFTSFVVQVMKNGQALPDSTNAYSRGDIVLRSTLDYLVVVSYDLMTTGPVSGILTTVPGSYSSNLSVGFGNAFPFQQWKFLTCLEVLN
ncbi:MAG: hypothetical protein C4523_07400 [Myxococcales bacterium]|nr:MAG: hypothetical protein C4523_07400 [Myxococcales bacterium]